MKSPNMNRRSLLKTLAGAVAGLFVAPSFQRKSNPQQLINVFRSVPPTKNAQQMIQESSAELVRKTLERFDNDPEVARLIREIAMKRINETINAKVTPTRSYDDVRDFLRRDLERRREFRRLQGFSDWT